jgi:membrane protease YdiL (CAAX protease family)
MTVAGDAGSGGQPGNGAATEEADAPGDEASSGSRAIHVGIAVLVTIAGVFLSGLGSLPGYILGIDSLAGLTAAIVGSGAGFVVAGLAILLASGRGLGYLDVELPGTRREWGLVVGVIVGAFAFRTVALLAAFAADVEPSVSPIALVDVPTRTLLLLLIPVFLLVVGPTEELLFRGVLQKYLREVFSPWSAILGAGLLFGGIHVFALVGSTNLGTAVSLSVITVVGFVLGWLYERTGSLPAAMLAHGTYNALIAATALAFEVVL